MKNIFFVILASQIFSGCGDNNLPVYSHLDSLRVIALLADQPEVAPGTTVTITPYVSDATGNGRSLTYSASVCPDPGVGAGATPTCVGSAQAVTLATSQAVTLPTAAHSYTGAVNTLSVSVPTNTLAGQNAINTYNGISLIVTYDLTSSDGVKVSSYRRIIVSQGHALNTNPTITDILNAGVSFNSMPTALTSLTPSVPTASSESFTYQDSSGNVVSSTENLLVTWFTNAGDFQYIRTDSVSPNQFTPGKTVPASGKNTFVFVVRDGRGGDFVLQKDF